MVSQQGRLVALVDYHNVRRQHDRTSIDCAVNLAGIIQCILEVAQRSFEGASEVSVRLYGGWIDEYGALTRCADWILRLLPDFRGLSKHLRVLPELVLSAACLPREQLRGTMRAHARQQRQKMVDALMTLDAVAYGQRGFGSILVVSDDDDLVPAALGAAVLGSASTCLARFESLQPRPNDKLLAKLGITLAVIPKE